MLIAVVGRVRMVSIPIIANVWKAGQATIAKYTYVRQIILARMELLASRRANAAINVNVPLTTREMSVRRRS